MIFSIKTFSELCLALVYFNVRVWYIHIYYDKYIDVFLVYTSLSIVIEIKITFLYPMSKTFIFHFDWLGECFTTVKNNLILWSKPPLTRGDCIAIPYR